MPPYHVTLQIECESRTWIPEAGPEMLALSFPDPELAFCTGGPLSLSSSSLGLGCAPPTPWLSPHSQEKPSLVVPLFGTSPAQTSRPPHSALSILCGTRHL